LETPEVEAGESAVLTLFWEPMAPFPADDFSVYLGARSADGGLAARTDTTPVGRFAPVNRWLQGQVIRDANLLLIPPGTPPGDYSLEIGFFSPTLGQALDIHDADGARGNRIPVAQVRVVRPDHPASDSADLGIASVLPEPISLAENGPSLLGYEWAGATDVNAGDGIPVTLLWRAGEEALDGVEIVTRLSAPGSSWQRPNGRVPGGSYPMQSWSPGELVRDTWPALLPAGAPSGRYHLELVAVAPEGERVLLDLGEATVTDRPHQLDAPAPAFAQEAEMGGATGLAGYDVGGGVVCGENVCLNRDAPLELTLWWQALAESNRDLTRFLHVLDAEGGLVSQRDGFPGGFPATSWLSGEYLRDVIRFEPGELPVGRYQIVVGLYDPATGQRLKTPDGADSILLSQALEVE
jgi:hypothetical protein